MEEAHERRGPIEKGEKGWPINPFGVIALLVFIVIIGFLIVKPLTAPKTVGINEQQTNPGGAITTPAAGAIIKGDKLTVELSPDDAAKVSKVQFWVKTYADNKWQMIGEVSSAPYKLDWQIPSDFQNKAIAITAHILTTDGKDIKDPGGWREGIILLSQ